MAQDHPSPMTPPKIGMKGFSLKSNGKSKPETGTGAKTVLGKRPRSALTSTHHSDSEDDERNGQHEEVTAFDASAGGAVRAGYKAETKGPLVIERVRNSDWKSEARRRTQAAGRGKNLLPKEVQEQRARQANGGSEVEEKEGEIKWGLTITKTKVVGESSGGDVMVLDTTTTSAEETQTANGEGSTGIKPVQTEDEKALDALLGKGPKAPDLIIHRDDSIHEQSQNLSVPANETDAYRLAIASAPDVSTLDEYERIPVADFGAALLRGMGWKGESSTNAAKAKEVKRRPNLLGLGAKELGDAEELGAWVQKADAKRLRPGPGSGGGDKRRGSGFVKPSDYKRAKERVREERDRGRVGDDRDRERRGDRYRDEGRYSSSNSNRERERSRDRGSSRRDARDRDYRRR